MSGIPYGIIHSLKKMCAIYVGVIFAVRIALVCLLYWLVLIMTHWLPVMVLGNRPSMSMVTGGKRFRYCLLLSLVPIRIHWLLSLTVLYTSETVCSQYSLVKASYTSFVYQYVLLMLTKFSDGAIVLLVVRLRFFLLSPWYCFSYRSSIPINIKRATYSSNPLTSLCPEGIIRLCSEQLIQRQQDHVLLIWILVYQSDIRCSIEHSILRPLLMTYRSGCSHDGYFLLIQCCLDH